MSTDYSENSISHWLVTPYGRKPDQDELDAAQAIHELVDAAERVLALQSKINAWDSTNLLQSAIDKVKNFNPTEA